MQREHFSLCFAFWDGSKSLILLDKGRLRFLLSCLMLGFAMPRLRERR